MQITINLQRLVISTIYVATNINNIRISTRQVITKYIPAVRRRNAPLHVQITISMQFATKGRITRNNKILRQCRRVVLVLKITVNNTRLHRIRIRQTIRRTGKSLIVV